MPQRKASAVPRRWVSGRAPVAPYSLSTQLCCTLAEFLGMRFRGM
jgi:hypothetical protein